MENQPVDPKRTNLKAKKLNEFKFHAEPGDCIKDRTHLMFACPGCGKWGGVRCGNPKPAQSPSWDIVKGSTEDPETLTLSPSINCLTCCGWHGYLTDGIFVSC